jgi:hypothetical protein
MRINCPYCRTRHHWTRSFCPHCLRLNPKRPTILFLVLFALILGCVAIWVTVQAFEEKETPDTGTARPAPEEPSLLGKLLSTPAPEPPRDLKFER